MAKLLKHFGWGVKKSSHQISSGRSECNNSAQKSNSVHELLPKSPSRYQSNACLTSGGVVGVGTQPGAAVAASNPTSNRCEYDTRSLKLNLDGGKQQNRATSEKHQYQSLQKGTTGGTHKGKSDGFGSPGNSSNIGSIDSPEGTSSIDSPIIPKIVEEYCDPLDLTSLIDDDYSTPYDEVNKVLKDIQTNKADRLLSILPGEKTSVDDQHLAKVSLKLTSSSQVTSLRIKPRRPRDKKDAVEDERDVAEGDLPGKLDSPADKELSAEEIAVEPCIASQSPAVNRLYSEAANHFVERDKMVVAGQLYSNNSTSGGSVTVVATNDFHGFEPIDCGQVLCSIGCQGGVRPHADVQENVNSLLSDSSSPALPIKADRSSQTQVPPASRDNQPEAGGDGHPPGIDHLIRPSNACKSRPKSDGILISSHKDPKKTKHKHLQNGCLKFDVNAVKDNKCSVCQSRDCDKCCQAVKNHQCYQHKTLHKEFRSGEQNSSPSKSLRISHKLPVEQQSWFHGSIGRVDAEKLLTGRSEGTFLVRISESNNEDFSLSLKSPTGFLHIKIMQQSCEERDRKFILGQFSQPFDSVASMIQFYRDNKLPVRGNESLSLTSPLTVCTS